MNQPLVETSSQRSFFRRTYRGNVVKSVQNNFLRDDVELGYLRQSQLSQIDLTRLLGETKRNSLVVVDTNVALHHIDFLEYPSLASSMIVIPQTVLSELKKLNLSIQRRLLSLLRNEKRSFIFFPNEMCTGTWCKRKRFETGNDSNDRLIVNTAVYYKEILGKICDVIFVSNDVDNRKNGIEKGISSIDVKTYIGMYSSDCPRLLDFVSPDYEQKDDLEVVYDSHLSSEEMMIGIRSGRYHKGVIRAKAECWQDCYVVVNSEGEDARKFIYVSGCKNVNRAIDGDIVAVEITNECPPRITADTKHSKIDSDFREIEGIQAENVVHGKIVGIIRRNFKQFSGSIDMSSTELRNEEANDRCVKFVPLDKRIPCIWISTRRLSQIYNSRLLVAVDNWSPTSSLPVGHIVQVLGAKGDKEVETKILLMEFGVTTDDFSPAVISCLPPKDWKITPEIVANRSDFRNIPIVSIDPPGCKDIDDALHCVKLPNGRYQVGVHIADVTYFVLPDSPLDLEASNRSTSTYLIERRLDMLPGFLTTELCSLRSNEDHLAFSVLWEMDLDANIYDVQFCKSVIRSVASLTYDQAQIMLDNPCSNDAVNQSVNMLNRMAKVLRGKRIENGALTLASPEVRFKLDQETSDPTDVSIYALKEANALVEEFMLLANITVAKKMLKHYPTLAILRRHQPPSREQFAPLLAAAKVAGISLDIGNSKKLADSLDEAIRQDDPYFNKLMRILSTRCMMPAQYFCSGEIPKDQWHHYGLATPVYTHFTSPIRRYADVLVHRLLAAALGVIPLPHANAQRGKQQELCAHMNRRHRAAQYAQRASVQLYTNIFFTDKVVVEDGYVININSTGITAIVPKYGIEEFIDSKKYSQRYQIENYSFNEEELSVKVISNDGKERVLRILEKICVEIKILLDEYGEKQLQLMIIH